MVISNSSDKNKGTKRKRGLKSTNFPTAIGVQKIKSALRQTRRLLNKDNLAADVRVESERRLKSLETDLKRTEQSQKERHNALKYHKVKFFERQKVCRKIKQVKNELGNEPLSPTRLAELEESLFSLRVDLNYILHYPKLQKYISLFPSSESSVNSETDTRREELRRQAKAAMLQGELDAKPELRTSKDHKPQEQMLVSNVSKYKKQKPNGETQSKDLSGDAFFDMSDSAKDQ